ncbi:MAG: PASTA domain-containing protein, partial [Solirubrobacterales bacterium]
STTEEAADTSSAEMPDVVGQSLTSAKSTLESKGIAWEASDSAASDNTDAYDVCATVPEPGRPAPAGDSPAKLKVAKSFECAGAEESPAKAATSDSPPAGEAAGDVDAESGSSGKIKVPNVVGKSHQFGQDAMQEAGLYMLAEVDATGQDRMLILDRNWVVVKQRPKAGSRVSEDTTITLYSKKYTD